MNWPSYGSPQLTLHRADLLAALEGALPTGVVRLDSRVTALRSGGDRTVMEMAGADPVAVDVLVGADGIHSTVREALFGPDQPQFTGVVAYRAVVPAERVVTLPNLGAFTKWWGPDSATQIVSFPLNRGRDVFVFATAPQSQWHEESWSARGNIEELRQTYRGFHPEARALLDACDEVLKSALYIRDPLPRWSVGAWTLLGDACHPMMPFMAQGAGMAVEDAVVLARALSGSVDDPASALQAYEEARLPRTSRVQISSRDNEWLKDSTNGDWVYAYDAWAVPLPTPTKRPRLAGEL